MGGEGSGVLCRGREETRACIGTNSSRGRQSGRSCSRIVPSASWRLSDGRAGAAVPVVVLVPPAARAGLRIPDARYYHLDADATVRMTSPSSVSLPFHNPPPDNCGRDGASHARRASSNSRKGVTAHQILSSLPRCSMAQQHHPAARAMRLRAASNVASSIPRRQIHAPGLPRLARP